MEQYNFTKLNPLLTAVLIADLHADGNYHRDRNVKLRATFDAISNPVKPVDAVIAAGDITNSGHISEYTHLKTFLQEHLHVRKFLPQLGNHDARGCSIYPFFDEATELFQDFCEFCGIKTEPATNYYHTVFDGFHFIALSTERLPHNEAYISAEQASWFDHALQDAIKDGKPVFVINHQPPMGRNGSDENMLLDEGGPLLEKIMSNHATENAPVLYISGHRHVLNENTMEQDSHVYYLNLPSVLYGPTDDESGAYGFVLEVYQEELIIRCRDFEASQWISGYQFRIPLA